jgi:hypothetical protein
VSGTDTITAQGVGLPCTGRVDGSATPNGIVGDVTVPTNATCGLAGVAVNGNITAGKGSALSLDGGSVSKNVSSDSASSVSITDTTITGSATFQRTTGTPAGFALNPICGASIGADLKVLSNAAPFAVGDPAGCGSDGGNKVKGSVTVQKNVMPTDAPVSVLVSYNTIGKDLSCSGDKPPASGIAASNTVSGHKSGECATL